MTGNAGRCIIRFPMEGDHLACCGDFLCLWEYLLSGLLCIEVLLPNENQLQVSAIRCPLLSRPRPRALFMMNRLLLAQLYFAHFLFVLPRGCTFDLFVLHLEQPDIGGNLWQALSRMSWQVGRIGGVPSH